jgi:hypothetical protein
MDILQLKKVWSSFIALTIFVPNFNRFLHFEQRHIWVPLRIPGQDHNTQCGWRRRIPVDWCKWVGEPRGCRSSTVSSSNERINYLLIQKYWRQWPLIWTLELLVFCIDQMGTGDSLLRCGFWFPLNLKWISGTTFITLSGTRTCTLPYKWILLTEFIFHIKM